MNLTFDDVATETAPDVTLDATPETTDDAHYCQHPGCTNEVFRNGDRGRWPKKCEEHKATRTTGSGKRATPAQAKQAATVLGQVNDLLAVTMTAITLVPGVPIQLTNTASALAAVNEAFVTQAEQALATDPALCRAILRVGKMGGRAALAMAYVSLGVGIAPGVMADIAAMKEGKA